MLVRYIRSSLSVRRFLSSSSFTENDTITSNPNESLGAMLFRIRDSSKAPIVIKKWKAEGLAVSVENIRHAVHRLINHSHYHRALVILDSLVKQKIVELNSQDYATHLSLIAYVHGLDPAEKYFEKIRKEIKDEIIYDELLNLYVKRRDTAKAEALFEKMAENGFLSSANPYIRMMSLYTSIKKNDKAEEMIKEVKKHIVPNFDMYNIWLKSCASINDVEASDMVFSEMKEANVEPNCETHGILARLYIKNKLFEKAGSALKEMEELLSTGDRYTYGSLIRMYGIIGNKDGVLRIWEKMKLKFEKLNSHEYSLVIHNLLEVDSYEKAEEIYSEWGGLGDGATRLRGIALRLLKEAKDKKKPPSIDKG